MMNTGRSWPAIVWRLLWLASLLPAVSARVEGRHHLAGADELSYLPLLLKGEAGSPTEPEVTFAVIGDFGVPGLPAASVAQLVASWDVDFVVTVGDNRYGSNSYDSAVGQIYCDFMAEVQTGPGCAGGNSAINAFFPAAGNHDYSDGGGLSEYLDYFTLPGAGVDTSGTSGSERYYDVSFAPVHIFLLDSEGATNATDKAAQQDWLQAALAASSAPWQFVFLHHAPYSSGRHGSQGFMQWPYKLWGADMVFAGHDHTYERILINDLPYFVNGLGGSPRIYEFGEPIAGSQVRYHDDHGAQRVTVSGSSVTVQFYSVDGVLIDQLTLD